MTVLAVLATPPRERIVLEDLPESAPVSAAEAATLYEAFLKDTFRAIDASGGDLLVNYRTAEDLPDGAGVEDAEAELREVVADALDEPGSVRFERQVGVVQAVLQLLLGALHLPRVRRPLHRLAVGVDDRVLVADARPRPGLGGVLGRGVARDIGSAGT